LVNNGAFCLAQPGRLYVVYLPHGDNVTVKLDPGRYQARQFNPRSGEYAPAPNAEGATWRSPTVPDRQDWVFLLTTI
jgi:Putative collagen-binding domain of a collagenase